MLSEVEAKALLASAGIPVVEAKLATTADEATNIAADIGYPVALKIVSEQITHKSDVGGVVLNVEDADAVRAAFGEITKAGKKADAKAQIDGVSVQRMAEPGVEVITGMTMDPSSDRSSCSGSVAYSWRCSRMWPSASCPSPAATRAR